MSARLMTVTACGMSRSGSEVFVAVEIARGA
jgi:hypothetical protein